MSVPGWLWFTFAGLLGLVGLGAGTYFVTRTPKRALRARRGVVGLEPPVDVLNSGSWYLQLESDGSASWYTMPCRRMEGSGHWGPTNDGGLVLTPAENSYDQRMWRQFGNDGLERLVMRKEGNVFKAAMSEGRTAEWSPPVRTAPACTPQGPRNPQAQLRWCAN